MRLPTFGRSRDLHEEIRRHYDRFWGAGRIEEVHWTPGPVASRLPQLHVAKIAPVSDGEAWVVATIGMSDVDAAHNHGLELVALSGDAGSAVIFKPRDARLPPCRPGRKSSRLWTYGSDRTGLV